jgi:hypothetical protein
MQTRQDSIANAAGGKSSNKAICLPLVFVQAMHCCLRNSNIIVIFAPSYINIVHLGC